MVARRNYQNQHWDSPKPNPWDGRLGIRAPSPERADAGAGRRALLSSAAAANMNTLSKNHKKLQKVGRRTHIRN